MKLDFSEDIAASVCERIMTGRSLRDVCSDEDIPARSTIYKWLAENEAFADQYARACDVRADDVFDELFDIADNATNDWMERKGKEDEGWQANGENVNRSRLRIDARKWALARMAPRKYGEKLDLNHTGLTINLPQSAKDA